MKMITQDKTESKKINVNWQDLVFPVGKYKCLKCGEEYSLLFGGICERCLRKAGKFK